MILVNWRVLEKTPSQEVLALARHHIAVKSLKTPKPIRKPLEKTIENPLEEVKNQGFHPPNLVFRYPSCLTGLQVSLLPKKSRFNGFEEEKSKDLGGR